MKYFVVVAHPQTGIPIPILNGRNDDDDIIALYDTEGEARAMAEGQPLCRASAYEIFEWEYVE